MQMNAIENYTLPEGRSLGLKVVHKDGRPEHPLAPKGFRWDLNPGGITEAPDWDTKPECGGGLHLWAWAQGDLGFSSIWRKPEVVWLVAEYETASAVDFALHPLSKVPKCRTIAVSSNRKEVVSFIKLHTPVEKQGLFFFEEKEVEEGDVEVGDGGIAIVRGKGTARAEYGGSAFAGDGGTAIAGASGRATAGKGGYASVGVDGKAKAGEGGILCFCGVVLAVGEHGIKPDTFYQVVWSRTFNPMDFSHMDFSHQIIEVEGNEQD